MLFHEYHQEALRLRLFDPSFYLDSLIHRGLSVGGSEHSLFEHFASNGWAHGLSPSLRFSVPRYLACYSDVREMQVDPMYHYLIKGRREGRTAFPVHDDVTDIRLVALCRQHLGTSIRSAVGAAPVNVGPIGAQVALARSHGISAFCIPYDQSCGTGLLDKIDQGSAVCILLDSSGPATDESSLEARYRLVYELLGLLADQRYLRVCGQPLLVVNRPELISDARLMFELWREVARRHGLGGLFIARISNEDWSGRECGLDALIDSSADHQSAMPVFPAFIPQGRAAWTGSSNKPFEDAPESFRNWLTGAAQRTRELAELGVSQLVFIDPRNGSAEESRQVLSCLATELQAHHRAVMKLQQLATGIMVSNRPPILFLFDQPDDDEWILRLIESLGQSGDIACFGLDCSDEPFKQPPPCAASFYLWEAVEAGWKREEGAEYLARLLRGRGDLIIVASSLPAARFIAPFATAGHRIVCLLHELEAVPRSLASAVVGIGRQAHRIIVSSESIRSLLSSGGAVAREDIEVMAPEAPAAEERAASSWANDAAWVGHCLLGLGNEGKRIRSTGKTLGRQTVADDLCVVIPSYNHQRYIVEALDSILAQSVRPKEIRIIDDGSTDGSSELVRSLADQDQGIIVQARENRGAERTINQGVGETQCPIIAVLNSDDRWHPLRIERLIDAVRGPEGADVVFSRIRFMRDEAVPDKVTWYENGVYDFNRGTPLWLSLLFCNFLFTTSNLIAKRSKFLEIGGLAPFRYCHDLDYILRAIVAGHDVRFREQTLCEYRFHDSNTISQDMDQLLLEEAWIIAHFISKRIGQISEAELAIIARRVLEKRLGARVLGILRTLRGRDAEYDYRTIRFDPFYPALEGNIEYYGALGEPLGMSEVAEEMRRLVGSGGGSAIAGASAKDHAADPSRRTA